MHIRHREPKDLPFCISALQAVYNRDRYPIQGTANAESFLCSARLLHAWVAVDSTSQIIGHVAVSAATDDDVSVALYRSLYGERHAIAVLGRLFVHPDARGKGAASALIRAAVAWGVEGKLRLVLFALAKDREAMTLYERMGWECFGKTRFGYGDGEEMEAICFASPEDA